MTTPEAKTTPVKASVAEKAPAKKAPAKKAPAKKAAATQAAAPKAPSPKATAKKAPAPKAAPKPSQPAKPSKAPKVVKPAKTLKAPKAAKPVKIKIVRDSFTMPEADFALIDQIKQRALGWKQPAKKSEVLRAALQALQALPDAKLRQLLGGLAPIKKGRPKNPS